LVIPGISYLIIIDFTCEAAELFMVAPELSAPDPLKLHLSTLQKTKNPPGKMGG